MRFVRETLLPLCGRRRPGDDGTNIGDAIAWGLDALLAAPPKRKVLVLLTDGNNEPAVPNRSIPRKRPYWPAIWG